MYQWDQVDPVEKGKGGVIGAPCSEEAPTGISLGGPGPRRPDLIFCTYPLRGTDHYSAHI